MLALIPLLVQFVPEIVRWIGGDTAGTVAQQVASVAQDVLGTTDPAAAKALLADQAKVSDLRIALAKIGADQEKARLDAQTATLLAQLADVASARAQTVALAQSGSRIAYGAPVVSLVVLAVFAIGFWLVFHMAPGEASQVQIGMVEILKAAAISVVSYWVGSSAGSSAKTEMIYNSTPNAPAGAAPRPFSK